MCYTLRPAEALSASGWRYRGFMFERPAAKTIGCLQQQAQPAPPNDYVRTPHESNHHPDAKTLAPAWDFTQVPAFGPGPPPSLSMRPSNVLPAQPRPLQATHARIQAKLRVSAPDDAHEKEADRVAEQVSEDM